MAECKLHELNERMRTDPVQTIANAEAFYYAEIERVAQQVAAAPQIRVVLLAGPSGSGKTTSANILCDRLKVLGRPCAVVSLDDFYRNRDEDYPLCADGSYDYENVTALQTDLLVACLSDIIAQRDCFLPHYEFETATRTDHATPLAAQEGGLVIVEGLHALNPLISERLPAENIYKLFVSVSTNIQNEDGTRLLSGRKIRFLRRAVRDSLYRGAALVHTLEMWPKVLAGEDLYLYPFKETAQDKIDTFHTFEVGLLLPFMEQLLAKQPQLESDNAFLALVMHAARQFEPVLAETVPQTSLLREFIPGGIYEHLY